MKRCQFCGAVSTIHLTEIHENARREMHLCDRCGVERKLIDNAPAAQLNLPELLKLLLGEPQASTKTVRDTALTCECCGLKYAQFRTAGRFGCPEDYDVFQEPLMPILERIHRGTDHAGKAPRSRAKLMAATELHERLAAAIAAEDYELAARLRDELKRKDASN